MERIKSLFQQRPSYEQIHEEQEAEDGDTVEGSDIQEDEQFPFSWLEYSIFLLLGVAMLWAWNMFLAAAPYFQHRFQTDQWILNHFQAAEISVSTVANMGSMIVLSKLQTGASYPRRISSSLIINIAVFAVLALSTTIHATPQAYFGFLMLACFAASLSTGLIQNGLFSYVSGYGRSEYTQAIMTGQGVAGVLPPLAQMISVAVVPSSKQDDSNGKDESSTSALIYFLTATLISIIALLAFSFLLRRESNKTALKAAAKATFTGVSEDDSLTRGTVDSAIPVPESKPSIPLMTLFLKLRLLSAAVFICFAVTMVFPVFTASIQSVSGIESALFIPLAFLLWNAGDLAGRVLAISPRIRLTHFPFALFCIAMARLTFIPLYFLCNIKGRGATVSSDFFYLLIVQGLFGLTNGYLGSQCMMGAGEWVSAEEREAAGGFMGLMLVAGLTVGSLLSFLLGDV